MGRLNAVTGAFGYSGRYITWRLLEAGERVITLTNSLSKENPFGDRVQAYPFCFDAPEKLIENLHGVDVLYNTYWVRFNYGSFSHGLAVQNTQTLFAAAKAAGVKRIVHISITNPSEDSPLEYFHGKAVIERILQESGLSYAILRPTVLFGKEDILINNIAWTLRRFPIFGIFGDGGYRLQPIYVDDLARLAVEHGAKEENVILNAIGPETFTFRELVQTIGTIIGRNRLILPFPPRVAYTMGVLIGKLMGDIFITWSEVEGLMANLLYVNAAPTGLIRLSNWAAEHADVLGQKYANELQRRRIAIETFPGGIAP